MKKTKFFSFFSGAALIALFAMSCDEDLTSTPLSFDHMDSTTIRFYPKAELDLTSAGDESVPAGTEVTVTVPYSHYSSAGTGGSSNSSIVVRDTVNASGYVEFTIPVDDNGVVATVSIHGFEYDQVQANGSTKTVFINFSASSYSVTIGGTKNYTLTGSTSVIDESSDLLPATLVGNVTAELNLQTSGLEAAPEGTVVVITKTSGNEDFETETTLDANGSFSVEVQVHTNGNDDFEVVIRSFVTAQTQTAGTTPATLNVEFDSKTVNYNNIEPGQNKIQNIALDAPTVVDPDGAVEHVTISGIIYSEINEDEDPDEREPLSSQTFVFFTLDSEGEQWSQEVTTNASGKYTVNPPVGQPIYVSCLFEMDRTLDTGEDDPGTGDDIFETNTYRLNIPMSDEYEVISSVSFDQGGIDIGSETGGDVLAGYWSLVTAP